MISTYIRTEGFYVKTTIIHQLTRLRIPDCTYTENMFINFIHVSLYDTSLMQNILYQIKGDVAVWKRLECPQHKQGTWWQIVATRYTGWRSYIDDRSINHNKSYIIGIWNISVLPWWLRNGVSIPRGRRFHATISFPKIRRKKNIHWNLFPHFGAILAYHSKN